MGCLMARSSEVANTFCCNTSLCRWKNCLLAEKADSSRTLTILSQPAETMTGFWGLGENLTQETHSVWPFSVMVYLQSPRVFHSLMVLSRDPETI